MILLAVKLHVKWSVHNGITEVRISTIRGESLIMRVDTKQQ